MLAPKLRFKREDGTDYPEWIEKTIGEYCDILDNMRKPITKKDRETGIYPYYGSTNIQDYVSGYIFDEPLVLIGEDAAPFMDFRNKPIAQLAKGKYWVNNHAHCLRPQGNVVFFFYSMLHKDIRKYINNPERAKLNQGDMVKIPILLPCLEEQQKIAEFLSTVDEVIARSEAEVANLERQKKAAMQKIFSQEVRFKREDGSDYSDWKDVKFGSLIEEYRNRTSVENEDVLLSSAISGMFFNTELFGHQRGKSNIGYLKIDFGTFILSAQNLHLGNANVNLRFEHGIISPAYKTYHIKGCDLFFIAQWIKRVETNQFFYDATTAGASQCRRNVDWNVLYKQTVTFPCLEEQQKIADFLSAYDEAISYAKQEFAKWKELKKGLLQQMFV